MNHWWHAPLVSYVSEVGEVLTVKRRARRICGDIDLDEPFDEDDLGFDEDRLTWSDGETVMEPIDVKRERAAGHAA